MSQIVNTAAQRPAWLGFTDEVCPSFIPIGTAPGGYVTMLRLVCPPCVPGDILDVSGFARITDDAALPRYTVGVGYHGWAYDADDGVTPVRNKVWTLISPTCGDNVTPDRHHMPLVYCFAWQVPATWPSGHRPVIVARADAESTAVRSGDRLTVDKSSGELKAVLWH